MRVWLWRIVVAFDQLGNTIFRGRPGETISARAGTARRDNRLWGTCLCWALDKVQENHCDNARSSDILRAQQVYEDLKFDYYPRQPATIVPVADITSGE